MAAPSSVSIPQRLVLVYGVGDPFIAACPRGRKRLTCPALAQFTCASKSRSPINSDLPPLNRCT